MKDMTVSAFAPQVVICAKRQHFLHILLSYVCKIQLNVQNSGKSFPVLYIR